MRWFRIRHNRPRVAIVALATVLLLTLKLEAAQSPPVRETCVDIRPAGRLKTGDSFRAVIAGSLEFRLTAAPDAPRWVVSVGPPGTVDDYLWLVSPPLQTAPHLVIGAAYHHSAAESAQLTPRRFQFVLTREEYERVRGMIERNGKDRTFELTAEELERMGRGRLMLTITGFSLREPRDVLDWITFEARACVPRD